MRQSATPVPAVSKYRPRKLQCGARSLPSGRSRENASAIVLPGAWHPAWALAIYAEEPNRSPPSFTSCEKIPQINAAFLTSGLIYAIIWQLKKDTLTTKATVKYL
jgi:hypothetical protein